MTWSPTPTDTHPSRQGWSPTGPVAVAGDRQGWWVLQHAVALDAGLGSDLALLDAAITGRDSGLASDSIYMGLDPTQDFELRIPVRDSGLGSDLALLTVPTIGRDAGLGSDLARAGLYGTEGGLGSDLAAAMASVIGRDSGGGSDWTALKALLPGRDQGASGDKATSGFTAHAAALTSYTTATTTTYTIPVWSRYVDIIILGAGGGGGGHAFGSVYGGQGGEAGTWKTLRLERGVDIPWTLTSISVTIGGPGSGGSGNSNGTAGNATTVTVTGVGTITAAGGPGGRGTGTSPYGAQTAGLSPGNQSFQGGTYTGGTGGTTTSGNGNAASAPGAGGGGGNSGVFVGTNRGGAGAPGVAHFRASQ